MKNCNEARLFFNRPFKNVLDDDGINDTKSNEVIPPYYINKISQKQMLKNCQMPHNK